MAVALNSSLRDPTVGNNKANAHSKMPPQAGGFRYTPTSYLQKTTREENRPWNDTTGHEDDDQFHIVTRGQAAIKKGSRDAHFQNRVAKKKNAYRALLKRGDDNSEATGSSNVSGMDDFSNDNFYGNPDTYFDSGYGSSSGRNFGCFK